ncbi:MAG: tetratricopeptide repeat protein, partial [Myxococcales bacterium]|nr:tetratricopeptide repeat protein [Myxococcales bacterium]
EVPIQKMVEQFPRVTGWRGGWLLFLVEQSRLDEAGDTLDVLLAEGALAAPKRNEWFALIGAMTIAAERVGHRQCAEALLVKLQPHADQLALVGYGSYCFGSVHQLIGQCHSALGEFPLAEHHFRRAIEVNRVAGARPAMARALSDLARLYATNQRDHERIACLRHAASICSQLGMYRLRRRLREVRS